MPKAISVHHSVSHPFLLPKKELRKGKKASAKISPRIGWSIGPAAIRGWLIGRMKPANAADENALA